MEPEHLILFVILAALTLYAIFGGADFGGGIWEFNTAFQSSDKERRLIQTAIGPVWEANHVWLLFVLMLMTNAFPSAWAALSQALFVPLLLALVGIVFRGAAFAFRAYAVGAVSQQRLWGTVFALASTMAPFFLGASMGAIASGRLEITADGHFTGDFLVGWISPLSIFTAFFAVGMSAYLAAFFLTREAMQIGDEDLRCVWRQRSLATGMWMGILALVGLVFVSMEAPFLREGFFTRGWPLVGTSVLAGVVSLIAMWRDKINVAVLGAATTVGAVTCGWGISQFPFIVPPSLTVEMAKAPANVLWWMVGSTAVGISIVAPSIACLLVLFKRTSRELGNN